MLLDAGRRTALPQALLDEAAAVYEAAGGRRRLAAMREEITASVTATNEPTTRKAAAVRQRSSLLKAVITAFPCVSLPFLAVPLRSQPTLVAIRRPPPAGGRLMELLMAGPGRAAGPRGGPTTARTTGAALAERRRHRHRRRRAHRLGQRCPRGSPARKIRARPCDRRHSRQGDRGADVADAAQTAATAAVVQQTARHDGVAMPTARHVAAAKPLPAALGGWGRRAAAGCTRSAAPRTSLHWRTPTQASRRSRRRACSGPAALILSRSRSRLGRWAARRHRQTH
eukprot:SAG22_NODE_3176_length_1874_cov_2.059155_1_plen_284_part_00